MFEISSSPVRAVIVTPQVTSVPGVRDEELRAVDDPGAVAELGGRARRAGVGAGVGLRQAEGRELPARCEIGEPALLLLVGAVEQDRHRPERGVRGDGDRHRRVDACQLLDRDRVRDGVPARTAVLLRNRKPHEAELTQLRHELVREAAARVEIRSDRLDALPGERSNGVADQLLLGSEVEVHAAPMVATR